MVKHHVIAASVTGNQHQLNDMPNQDAYSYQADEGTNIALVADGHGSKTCFRSAKGAAFAVEEGKRLLNACVEQEKWELLHDSVQLFDTLLKRWSQRILKDLKEYPFSREEVGALSDHQRKIIRKNALVAYGTTLTMTLFHEGRLYVWKVGDGSVLIRDTADSPVQELLDRKWFGVETHSLSVCNPEKDVEFMIHTPIPKDLLLCSDGYKNAFKTDAGFKKVLSDYSVLYTNEETGYIENNIEEWLTETSKLGSGDDITLVLMLTKEGKI